MTVERSQQSGGSDENGGRAGAPPADKPPAEREKPVEIEIENRTARRIRIDTSEGELVLAPFGIRRFAKAREEKLKADAAPWLARGYVQVRDACEDADHPALESSTIASTFFVLVIGAGIALFARSWKPLAVAGLLFLIAVIGVAQPGVGPGKRKTPPGKDPFRARFWRAFGMTLVCATGFGLPVVALCLQAGPSWLPPEGQFPSAPLLRGYFFLLLFALFVGTAATIPALLFFLFNEQRKEVAKDQFFRDILRLDPSLRTIDEAQRSYQPLITDVFEARRGALFIMPVLLSTILLALGWTVTVLPTAKSVLAPLVAGDLELNMLFIPNRSAFTFAFLGSYFFAVNMAFRRYVRADLGPKAYSHIAVRIIIASILVWVASQVYPHALAEGAAVAAQAGADKGAAAPVEAVSWALLLLAFIIGIVPDTGLVILNDTFKRNFVARWATGLENRDPLTRLEGITLYDRARFLEEGIENVENLAHHNMVDLILRTRIPTTRLVDLVDQAILYLHACDVPKAGDSGGASTLGVLRGAGVRTATDLETVAEAAKDDFEKILGAEPEKARRLKTILAALKDDEWMCQLRSWRNFRKTFEQSFRIDDFETKAKIGALDVGEETKKAA